MESLDFDPTRIDILTDPKSQRMVGRAIHGNTPFDVPFISRVTDNLWQGGCENGLVLPEQIEHLVSLYPWERYTVQHTLKSSKTYRMYDAEETPNLEEVVAIAQYVNECREDGPTLVHCQAGLNRSGLIAALALIIEDGLSPAQAIKHLRDQRSPAVLCNRTFESWLLDLCHCGCWMGDYPCEVGTMGDGCAEGYEPYDATRNLRMRFNGPAW